MSSASIQLWIADPTHPSIHYIVIFAGSHDSIVLAVLFYTCFAWLGLTHNFDQTFHHYYHASYHISYVLSSFIYLLVYLFITSLNDEVQLDIDTTNFSPSRSSNSPFPTHLLEIMCCNCKARRLYFLRPCLYWQFSNSLIGAAIHRLYRTSPVGAHVSTQFHWIPELKWSVLILLLVPCVPICLFWLIWLEEASFNVKLHMCAHI